MNASELPGDTTSNSPGLSYVGSASEEAEAQGAPHASVSSGPRVDLKEMEPHLLPSLPLWGRAASHFPFPGPHLAGLRRGMGRRRRQGKELMLLKCLLHDRLFVGSIS